MLRLYGVDLAERPLSERRATLSSGWWPTTRNWTAEARCSMTVPATGSGCAASTVWKERGVQARREQSAEPGLADPTG